VPDLSVFSTVNADNRPQSGGQYSTPHLSYAPAVKRASPSIVSIYTRKRIRKPYPLFNEPQLNILANQLHGMPSLIEEETNLGSGVIVSKNGHIITNLHVITGAQDIQISLKDGRSLTATLIGGDSETDLAVLKVDSTDLPVINFGDPTRLEVGDIVLAIGNPFGLGHTVTSGIVSALGRSRFQASSFDNFIQTDAAINPGNSGGGLINTQGELVGINTITITNDGGSQGIGFAIPSDLAQYVLQELIEFGEVRRGWIGIEARELTPALAQQLGLNHSSGLLILGVMSDGPAHVGGIRGGDIVTHINGKTIISAQAAFDMITRVKPGNKIKIQGIRDKKTANFKITVTRRPNFNKS